MESTLMDFEKYTELFCHQSSKNYFIQYLQETDAEYFKTQPQESEFVSLNYDNENLIQDAYDQINELNKLHNELSDLRESPSCKETVDEINQLQSLLENIENEERQVNIDMENFQQKTECISKLPLQSKQGTKRKSTNIKKGEENIKDSKEDMNTDLDSNDPSSSVLAAKEKEYVFSYINTI